MGKLSDEEVQAMKRLQEMPVEEAAHRYRLQQAQKLIDLWRDSERRRAVKRAVSKLP